MTAGPSAPGLLRRSWAASPPLTAVSLAMIVLLVATVVGLIADPRVITGAPAWLKPAKFAVSIAIYSFTFGWLLTVIDGYPRLVRLATWVTVIGFVIEMLLIAGSAALGLTSHFNVSSPAHTAVWSTMASAIVATWTASLVVAVLLLRQRTGRMADPAFAWALRLGVLISSAGMAVAFFMTSPTADQLTQATAGHGMPIAGAHAVGVSDGGPGLPVLGWSTAGGDLRAPHFFGLHALQLLPLLGLALLRFAPTWLDAAARARLVVTGGLGYFGFVALTTWQALRGQPLLSPDWVTLAAAAVLVAGTLGAAALIADRARSMNTNIA